MFAAHCGGLREHNGKVDHRYEIHNLQYLLQTYFGHMDRHGIHHLVIPALFGISGNAVAILKMKWPAEQKNIMIRKNIFLSFHIIFRHILSLLRSW